MLAGTAILQLLNGMSGNSFCTSVVFPCKYVLVKDVTEIFRLVFCCTMFQGCMCCVHHVESCDMLFLMGFSGLFHLLEDTLCRFLHIHPEDLRL